MPYTKENEEIIINRMIAQARNRSEIIKLNDAPIGDFIFEVVFIGVEMIVFYGGMQYHNTALQVMAILGAMPSFRRASNYIKSNGYKLSKTQLKEIKKYDIYLSNMKDINTYYSDININTLDNYSLHDLKKVKKKVLEIRNTKK